MAAILEVPSATTHETIPVDLDEVLASGSSPEQLADVVQLLRNEHAAAPLWVALVDACVQRNRTRAALALTQDAFAALPEPRDHVPFLCLRAHVHLALARRAPKLDPDPANPILRSKDPYHPEHGLTGPVVLKSEYYRLAQDDLDRATAVDPHNRVARDLLAALAMAQGQLDLAQKRWDAILADEPTNLVAQMGKVRQISSRFPLQPRPPDPFATHRPASAFRSAPSARPSKPTRTSSAPPRTFCPIRASASASASGCSATATGRGEHGSAQWPS